MTKKEREMCHEWYKRGIRDGRSQVVEGIFNAMGLDYHAFEHDPVSDVDVEEAFNTALVAKLPIERAKEDCLQRLVSKQVDDPALWFEAATAPEAYLQKALRELHETIEGKTQVECVADVLNAEEESS